MNCLLDTCALLHLANADPELGVAARRAIANPASTIYVSVVSAAEISIKAGKGKLVFPIPVLKWIEEAIRLHHLTLLPLDLPESAAAGQLPWIHSDPFDRLLIATARLHNLTILTSDRIIPTYPGVKVVW
jgi:PIN domain nuclease of toxin-antitoxin system